MYLHRDATSPITPGLLVPFIPWLHGTESCEHVFAEARKIVKDFCMLDFIYMVPKLQVSLRQAILDVKGQDAKATASGYNHTYLDTKSIDIIALATFPGDEQIEDIANMAAQDADALIQVLGVSPAALNRIQQLRQTTLPSLHSILYGMDTHDTLFTGTKASEDIEDESDVDESEGLSDKQIMQQMFDAEEQSTRTQREDNLVQDIACAATALTMNEMTVINELQNITDTSTMLLHHLEDQRIEADAYVASLKLAPMHLDEWNDNCKLGLSGHTAEQLDFEQLVEIRRSHETHQAATGIRTSKRHADVDSQASARKELVKRLHRIVRESSEQSAAAGTGAERALRWQGAVNGSGNMANAEAAAKAAATKALARRCNIFKTSNCSLPEDIPTARITPFRPIVIGDYGAAFHNAKVCLGKVVGLYAKSGGKNGKHGAVSDKDNIARLSYMTMQIFELKQDRDRPGILKFTYCTEDTDLLQVAQYAHILSHRFLFLVEASDDGGSITLNGGDAMKFAIASQPRYLKAFELAMKEFGKRNQVDS